MMEGKEIFKMPSENTIEYNQGNWLEAIKSLNLTIYPIEGYKENTLCYDNVNWYCQSISTDKVNRERETFFGDNIRDAIKIIKGRKENK